HLLEEASRQIRGALFSAEGESKAQEDSLSPDEGDESPGTPYESRRGSDSRLMSAAGSQGQSRSRASHAGLRLAEDAAPLALQNYEQTLKDFVELAERARTTSVKLNANIRTNTVNSNSLEDLGGLPDDRMPGGHPRSPQSDIADPGGQVLLEGFREEQGRLLEQVQSPRRANQQQQHGAPVPAPFVQRVGAQRPPSPEGSQPMVPLELRVRSVLASGRAPPGSSPQAAAEAEAWFFADGDSDVQPIMGKLVSQSTAGRAASQNAVSNFSFQVPASAHASSLRPASHPAISGTPSLQGALTSRQLTSASDRVREVAG
ncbi:unnamed protein product, partial [Polarella glacialis]